MRKSVESCKSKKSSLFDVSRRNFLTGASSLVATTAMSGCAANFGSSSSYLTNIVAEDKLSVVFEWTDIALQALRDQLVAPPQASRALTMGHVAGFLAVNGIEHRYDTGYHLERAPKGADPRVAYGVAAATAFAEHFQQPFLFDKLGFLARFPNSEAKTLGIEWGRKVGRFVIRERTNDGAEPSKVNFYLRRYPRRQDALRWRPTGPMFDSGSTQPAFRRTYHRGLLPGFGAVTPWAIPSANHFLARDFLDPASPEFAEQYDMVKELGGSKSHSRTDDQSQIAFFWEDGPWGVTPPGHFVVIAMQLFQHMNMSLVAQARAMALTSMAMADSAIATWHSKYTHDIIRPETAIRYRSNKFNNGDSRVVGQSNWKSLIPTPPFPAYTSGHSAFGASAARMIAHIIGRDRVTFSKKAADTVIWPDHLSGVTRSWNSLSQAADENGMSRIYGGVHWMADNVEGLRAGKAIADYVVRNKFRRVV
ncbi:MAG: vanadium-dependent haloperoxidase [Rhizobiales bacterium]|nr:vanadium-dependent haloperoxidase [Hyphomicrobiales bacterium]